LKRILLNLLMTILKTKELKIIQRLAKVKKSIQAVSYEYSRFDAIDNKNIYEIKCREKFYDKVLIEFDKYSFNLIYAQTFNKNFLYVVEMDKIYIFNISKLYMFDYNFNWEWKDLPNQTEFNKKEKIKKLVGYIDISQAIYEINK